MVVHLCSWARLRWTAGDSYPVPTVPKEQALNYLKRKRAARMKIKEEKTFQRELFTGHDSGASDVPLQPGSQLQNESPSLFIFFPPASQNSLQARWRSILSPYFYYHSWDVNTGYSLSRPKVVLNSHRCCFCGGVYKPRWWKCHLLLAGGWTARGESCHLAKPSGALYASDLHVSTCSKYNPLAFVDEPWAIRLPEGETGRGERERDRGGKREAEMGNIFV